MSNLKFYGATALARAAVKAHEGGSPLNPIGCRGYGTIFSYCPTEDKYHGKTAILGNNILALTAAVFVASVNEVLDGGGEVYYAKAAAMGRYINCSVTLGSTIDATKKMETPAEADKGTGAQAEAQAKETESSREVDQEVASEVPVVPEVEASPEDTTSESDETVPTNVSEIDWVYAESIIDVDILTKTMAKEELSDYADTFGITLSPTKTFANMIIDFKGAAGVA